MDKEQQIKEMTQDFTNLGITTRQGVGAFAEILYNAGYRKTFTSDLASDKAILAQVKQAKIDVLNELKEKIQNAIDAYWNSNGGGYYLAEDAINDIDEFIKEIGEINNDH